MTPALRNPTPKIREELQAFLELLCELFTGTIWSIWTPTQIDIHEDSLDLERNILSLIWKNKDTHYTEACMKFYDKTKPMYLQTDASREGLEAGLLQVRSSMIWPWDESSDNTTLQPIAFASKIVLGAKGITAALKGKIYEYFME